MEERITGEHPGEQPVFQNAAKFIAIVNSGGFGFFWNGGC
jgi:hypothetical protein